MQKSNSSEMKEDVGKLQHEKEEEEQGDACTKAEGHSTPFLPLCLL